MAQVTLAESPPANTPEWLAWRKGGLGASDLPTILGLDPYRTEHELWELKTGRAPDFTGNAKTRWGHRLEAVGLEVWAEANPDCDPWANDHPYRKAEWPHLWATPDGFGRNGVSTPYVVGIEVKVTSAWDDPPERVKAQCLAQAGLAELERVDVVRLSFEDDPHIFRIERDEAAIADILAAGEAWYVKHVLGDVEPPLAEGERPADDRQTALAADLRLVRWNIKHYEHLERGIRDDIIASVAGKGIFTGPGFRIEVRRSQGATRTGWKEVAAAYAEMLDGYLLASGADPAQLDTIVGLYQTTGTPTTSVYPTWNEEEAA